MAQIRRQLGELWKRLRVDRPPAVVALADDIEAIPVVVLDDASGDDWEDVFWSSGEIVKTASQQWYASYTFPSGYEYRIIGLVFELYGTSSAGDALQGVRLLYQPGAGTSMAPMLAVNTLRPTLTQDLLGSNLYKWQWPNNQTAPFNGRDVTFRAQDNNLAVFAFDWQFQADATVGNRSVRMTICVQRRKLYGKMD